MMELAHFLSLTHTHTDALTHTFPKYYSCSTVLSQISGVHSRANRVLKGRPFDPTDIINAP